MREALKRRRDLKKAYANSIADLDSKQAAYGNVQLQGEVETMKQEAVEKAEAALKEAKEVYETTSAEMQREFEEFKAKKAPEIKSILIQWVHINIEYCQRAEETWARLVPALDSIETVYAEEGEGS